MSACSSAERYFAVPGGVQQLTQGRAQKLKFPYNYNAFRFEYSANGLQASERNGIPDLYAGRG